MEQQQEEMHPSEAQFLQPLGLAEQACPVTPPSEIPQAEFLLALLLSVVMLLSAAHLDVRLERPSAALCQCSKAPLDLMHRIAIHCALLLSGMSLRGMQWEVSCKALQVPVLVQRVKIHHVPH